MSEPLPPHKKYKPSERSPLGRFEYTAADIEREIEAEAVAAVTAEAAEARVDTLASHAGTRRTRAVETDDKVGEPPTKRPKLDIAVVERREERGLITEQSSGHIGALPRSTNLLEAHVAPSRMGNPGLWSFRALEEEPLPQAEMEDLDPEDEENAAARSGPPIESDTGLSPAEQSAKHEAHASSQRAIDPRLESACQFTGAEAAHVPEASSPRAIDGQARLPYDTPILATRYKKQVELAKETGLEIHADDRDQAQPDSPAKVPAGPVYSTDGIGALSKQLKVGDAWS